MWPIIIVLKHLSDFVEVLNEPFLQLSFNKSSSALGAKFTGCFHASYLLISMIVLELDVV